MENDMQSGLCEYVKRLATASLAIVVGAASYIGCGILEDRVDKTDPILNKTEVIAVPERVLDGTWESVNLEGYQPTKPGYFNAQVGKKELRNGSSVNVNYITLEELARISKDDEISVHITEPSWCGPCFDKAKELGDKAMYLTVAQAQHIGWTGKLIPTDVKVKDRRIIENTE